MNIYFFEIEPWQKDYIKKKISGHKLFFSEDILTKQNLALAKTADILSPFIYSKINIITPNYSKNNIGFKMTICWVFKCTRFSRF